jgi:predicted outer membrane repeat protein
VEEFVRSYKKKVSRRRGQLGSAIAQALEGRVLLSTTWTVTSTADDGGTGTLRYAVNNSAAGDSIKFDATAFPTSAAHTITLGGTPIDINHNLTISGLTDPSKLVIDAALLSRVFTIDSGVTANISGVTIAHGTSTDSGGGIDVTAASLTLSNSIVEACSGSFGGGIAAESSLISITDCLLQNNSATTSGGGIYTSAGSLQIDTSDIDSNGAGLAGGGIFTAETNADITNTSVVSNTGLQSGGLDLSGYTYLINSTVYHNALSSTANPCAGGIATNAPLVVTNCNIEGNLGNVVLGGGAGGIFAEQGSAVTINNSTVIGNAAYGFVVALQVADQIEGTVGGQDDIAGDGDIGGLVFPQAKVYPFISDYVLQSTKSFAKAMEPSTGDPVVDSGVNSLAVDALGNPLQTDALGNPRISHYNVDIGAVEVQQQSTLTGTTTSPGGFSATANVSLSRPMINFTDSNLGEPTTNYTATIDWGDSTTSRGFVASDTQTPGSYAVGATHTYAKEGTYPVVITVTDPQGGSAKVTETAFVTDGTFQTFFAPITAIAGTPFNGRVGSFTDTSPAASATYFTATIGWGDGQSSTGGVSFNSSTSQYDIAGSHTYAKGGAYDVRVTITDPGGASAEIFESASVSGGTPTSTITAGATNFAATKGISVSPMLASFTDSNTGQSPSHYTASINWGDSSTSFGTVTFNSSTGKFQVSGTHIYAAVGTFTATINISDPEGGNAAPTAKATVADAAITPIPTTINATLGKAFTGVVGSFTDGDPAAPASYFTATITWGDGHTSAGAIAYNTTAKHFDVTGTNTYATATIYAISIAVKDAGGASATINSTAKVSTTTPPTNSILKGTGVSIAEVKGLAFAGILLATFSDTNPSQTPGYYTTTINWGDGSSSAGTVSYNATTKLFQVAGAHTYHTAATYDPIISISDPAGGSTSVTSKIYVADATMHAYPTTISATAGKPFTGVVGSFIDGDPASVASDFAAVITWGDGHTSAGTVTLNPTTKHFDITGTNTFAIGGTYSVTATPHDVGGMSIAIKSTANVTVVSGPQPKLSGASSVKEGSSEAISFSATDVGGKAITKWVINWGDGAVQALAGTATNDSHIYADGPATRVVTATATDASNLSAAATLIVGVLNVAPTATFTGNSPVQPNHTSTVTFSNVHDPSPTDTAAGFRYSFDFADNGTFEIVNSTSATATVPAIYLATLGVKTIHGRVSDKDGGFTDYYTTIDVVAQPLTTFGTTIKVVEGTKFSGNVGTFADPSGNTNPANYTATITWGDGHMSAGAVAYNATAKTFGVSGTNTYALLGSYAISVAVKSNTSAVGTIHSTASISDAALASTGSAVSGKEGVSLLGVVATFTDANPLAIAGNYVVSINWGDGTAASAGTVSFNTSTKRWQVAGSHTYRVGGTYTVTTSISDHGTSTTKATSTATIAGSTLNAAGVQLSILNSTLAKTQQKIATFTSSNPLLLASDFTATVNWGDGTTNNPTSIISIVWDATNKVFDVMATHPYSLLLISYTATITITEGKGVSTTTATSSIFTT